MKSKMTEFSYGYALTEDFVRHMPAPLAAAPVFPTLVDEGQRLGWDLKLVHPGVPIFLQFKVSEYMKARSAKEFANFNSPYYRFKIWARLRSDQHKLLLNLDQPTNEVYYVAPSFHQVPELNAAYLTQTVKQDSIFVRPTDIGPITDDKEHHVAFKRQPSGEWKQYVCSEPRELRSATSWEDVVEALAVRLSAESKPVFLEKELQRVGTEMANAVQRRFGRSKLQQNSREKPPEVGILLGNDLVERVAYLARTYFDCAMCLVSLDEAA